MSDVPSYGCKCEEIDPTGCEYPGGCDYSSECRTQSRNGNASGWCYQSGKHPYPCKCEVNKVYNCTANQKDCPKGMDCKSAHTDYREKCGGGYGHCECRYPDP